jgi:putative transcriptional regulator
MPKLKRNIGLEILRGLRELKRGEHGRVINIPNIASVRRKTGLSQARFAQLLGVSVRTLQDWEQGRRAPSGAARTLIMVADKNPRALLEVAWTRDVGGQSKFRTVIMMFMMGSDQAKVV